VSAAKRRLKGATDRCARAPAQGEWRLDFVAAENSIGFHAPQKTARVLAEAIDHARQCQLATSMPPTAHGRGGAQVISRTSRRSQAIPCPTSLSHGVCRFSALVEGVRGRSATVVSACCGSSAGSICHSCVQFSQE